METAEDGRIKRTASIAGGLNAEDDLSDLFRPTDRVDLTARVCTCHLRHVFIARCRSFKYDLHFIHLPPPCVFKKKKLFCVFQAARLGPGAQAGVQHGGS